jgi:thiamine-phosphate pyrophosphorylase
MPRAHSTDARIPNLVLVTDHRATAGRHLLDVVARALDAGLPAVQLRDKDLPGRDLWALAERLRVTTRRTGALLFVNDRIDVARAVDADGVQLGATSLPVEVARRLLGPERLVGVSVHALAEARATDADFVVFGPVYDTPSKRGYGPPQGEERLHAVVAASPVPVLAIGGVDAARVHALREAGAHGVAVIRAILAADDPGAAVRALLAA